MRLRVLGCSGGIGGTQNRTSSFLLDHDILIDAGTGVGDLSLAELALVDHIFVTHSHLDHVNSIAFIVDSVGAVRHRPITIHALGATIASLKKNLFNWDIWPDVPVEKILFQTGNRRAQRMDGDRAMADGADRVDNKGDRIDVVEMRVGDKYMIDQRELGEREVTHPGAGVNQDVVIKQKRGGAVLRAADTAGTTQYP